MERRINFENFPLSPPVVDLVDFSLQHEIFPAPAVYLEDHFVVKEEIEDFSLLHGKEIFPLGQNDYFDGEESSVSSESDSSFLPPDTRVDESLQIQNIFTDILLGGGPEFSTGFADVEHRYKSFGKLMEKLTPILIDPVHDHNFTQSERDHLKHLMQNTLNSLQKTVVEGVLNERVCQYKFEFKMNCSLPMDKAYQDNIATNTIFFFKDHAKTYICPQDGRKKPYALEMEVQVVDENGMPEHRDVDLKISLFRIFEGGRMEEVPEFKYENGKRKRCWGMIVGDVLKGKSRIQVQNQNHNKSKSTATQTLIGGKGKLYGRVEIPATPGLHRWVISPANLTDDIAKARSEDFVVKSKRTARKRKRDEEFVKSRKTSRVKDCADLCDYRE